MRRRIIVAIASTLGIVALLGGGATAAVLLTGHHTKRSNEGNPAASRSQNAAAVQVARTVETTAGTTTATSAGTSTTTPTSLLPSESQTQMTAAVQQLLLRFHQDISTGNWRDAWSLMSARKQQQALAEGGYSGWVTNQKSLGNYLDPTGMQVSIVSADPESGVATVDVTGMTWSPPGRSSCGWSGVTWAKYESGNWRYDPGYSTTPQRRAQWGPPSDTSSAAYSTWLHNTWPKLMGGRCVHPD